MKTRSNRTNNGYIGAYSLNDRDNGILSNQKLYQQAILEQPEGVPDSYQPNQYNVVTGNYQRPSEWLEMPEVLLGENKLCGIYAVYDDDSNWVAFTFYTNTGTYEVDWGDGTTSTVSSGSVAYKQYTRATYAALTTTVFRGYKTLAITVTPTNKGAYFTYIELNTKHNQSGLASYYSNGWLDIKMSAPNLVNITVSNYTFSNQGRSSKLEQFDFIGDNYIDIFMFIGCTSLRKIVNFPSTLYTTQTYWASRFHTCHSLQEFPARMLDGLWRATNTDYLFYYCFSLKEVPPLNTSNCTSMQGMFLACNKLKRIPYLDTSKATNLNNIFNSCYELEEVPYIDTSSCQNFSSAFTNCRSIRNWQTHFKGSSFTSLASTFANTKILYGPTFDSTSNVTSFNSTFTGCQSLITVPQYDYSAATDLRYMFRYCAALRNVPDLNTDSSLTNALQMFEFCSSLQYCPGITLSNVTNATSMFANCFNMHFVPSINTSSITTTTNMFFNCYSLSECGITGMAQTFSVSGCGMGATALNNLYTSLATVVGKTITVTGNWGTATDDPTIATGKGWTVTG